MNLRDALLDRLATLPGTRQFHIHVLVSSPRKHSNLYPFATPRPKTFIQDILILLSEQPSSDAPRVLVSAIEASLYHVPSSSSAVLYVSKVDSTGQAKAPSPTQILVRAFLTYYVDPTTRPLPVAHFWVHLFARAQGQYLFPNSAEFAGKRPLTDMTLCAWWKRMLGAVARDVQDAATQRAQGTPLCVRLFYLLPGLGELEAAHALERVYPTTSPSVPWTYGHPYAQTDTPLPCGSIGRDEKLPHIGHVVPWFDDDPKARFLDEIAYTTDAEGVKSPERKRPRVSHGRQRSDEDGENGPESKETSATNSGGRAEQTTRALKKVSIGEFWERMSFRQECIAGAVTGFFVMSTSCPGGKESGAVPQLEAGQVSAQMMKRVLTSLMTGHEFPSVERAVWSTRVLEEAIKGLCDGLEIVRPRGNGHSPDDSHRTPEPKAAEEEESLALPETPGAGVNAFQGAMDDVLPNEIAEAVCSGETYKSYIYGSVTVSNPDEPRKGSVEADRSDGKPVITVLTVRRKKRGKA